MEVKFKYFKFHNIYLFLPQYSRFDDDASLEHHWHSLIYPNFSAVDMFNAVYVVFLFSFYYYYYTFKGQLYVLIYLALQFFRTYAYKLQLFCI